VRRRAFLATAGIVLAVGLAAILRLHRAQSTQKGPIDVILISVDTLRADHLGCYGDRDASTPVLDALAGRGTRFAHVVAPAPLTLPSHGSLLTGVTPLRHGVHDNVGFVFGSSVPTLAERFRDAGYRTQAFVSGFPLERRFGLARGFEGYDDRFTRGGDAARPAAVERRADETVAAVDTWLREDPSIPERPLFLWIHFFDPHAPYEPPDPFKTRFGERPYDGEVAFVDAQIGVLLDHLKRSRPGRRSLVAVTADHGEGLGEHGEETHGLFVYDSTIRVPLILQGGGIPAGGVIESMVRLVDVAPTLLDVVNLPATTGLDGVSLRPMLTKTSAVESAPAYVESLFGRLCCGWAPLRGWRDEQWMLIDAPRVELYDTANDPGQLHNIAADRPSDVARLKRALAHAVRQESPSSTGSTRRDTLAQLQALGYVTAGRTTSPSLRDPKDMIAVSAKIGRILEIEDADPPRAARELTAILQADPENPLARRHLGMALMRQRRFGEAHTVLNALAADGDDSTETLTMLADLALERGDPKAARTLLDLLHTRDPADTSTTFKLGLASVQAGDMQRAVDLFKSVVAREPANVDALVDLAGALLKTGQPGDAATYFQRAIEAGAAGPLPLNGLAFAKVQAGDKRGAADAMRQSLRLEPNQPDIKAALAELLRR